MSPKTKKCPHCNANIPFLASVCQYCGNKIELESSAISKQEIIKNINSEINSIKNLKSASTFHLFLQYSVLTFSITLFFAFFATVIFHSTIGVYLFTVSPIAIIISIIFTKNNTLKKKLTKSVNQTIDKIKLSFVKNQNLLKIYDSKNPQIKTFAENFTQQIILVKQKLWKNSRNAVILNVILVIALNYYLINIHYSQTKIEYTNFAFYPTFSSVEGEYKNFIDISNIEYSTYFKNTITNKDTIFSAFIDISLKKLENTDTLQNFPNKKIKLIFANNNKETLQNLPEFSTENENYTYNRNNYSDIVRFKYNFKNRQEKNQFVKNILKNPNILITSK